MQTIALSVTISQTSNIRLHLNVALTFDSALCGALSQLIEEPSDLSISLFGWNVNVYILQSNFLLISGISFFAFSLKYIGH